MGLKNAPSRYRLLIMSIFFALAWLNSAVAQPAVYTAGGIVVDVTGDIATLRDQATMQAQRQALQKILSEIAPADQVAGLSLPGDDEISGWVQDFAIDEEKIAADRYIGRFTFRFQAEPLRAFLADNGIGFVQSQASAILVVPVLTDENGTALLWGLNNPWLAAWSANPPSSSLLRIIVPPGDAGDAATMSPADALAGDRQKLSLLARRHGAADAVIAEAALLPISGDGTQTLAIAVKRPGDTGAPMLSDQVTGVSSAQDELMRQGVEHAVSLMQQSWKSANMIDANVQGELAVDIPVADLKEWVAVKQQLAKVQGLKGAKLVSLTRSLAEMELSYIGTEEQFSRSLADQGLALTLSGEGQGTLKLEPNAPQPFGEPAQQPQPLQPSDEPAVSEEPAVAPQ